MDSKRSFLVWEPDKYPTYFFDRADARIDWMSESAETSTRRFWDLQVGDQRIERAAYTHTNQPHLADLISRVWHKLDHWYEETDQSGAGWSDGSGDQTVVSPL